MMMGMLWGMSAALEKEMGNSRTRVSWLDLR